MYIRSVRPSVRSTFAYRAWTALFSTIGGDCEALGKREDKSTPRFFRVCTITALQHINYINNKAIGKINMYLS